MDIAGRVTPALAAPAPMQAAMPPYWQHRQHLEIPDAKPNAVIVAAEQPVSTFSIDVDTASYGVVRAR